MKFQLLMLTLLCSFSIAPSAHAQGWMMHDLSVLFPMSQTIPDPTAITADTEGAYGKLIPGYTMSGFPVLEPSLTGSTQRSRLQLVGVRIEPPEVRLIWQVFQAYPQPSGRVKVLALDAAVHTFYQMTDVKGFMAELWRVSNLSRSEVSANLPLSVHPSLAKNGWNGTYGQGFRNLILKSIGERNLFKITFMATRVLHLRWDFGGFNVQGGRVSPLAIPKLGNTSLQVFVNNTFPPNDFSGGIGPAPKGQDEFNRLIADSTKSQVKEPKNLELAHLMSRKIENPTLGNSSTVDCVSCHVAQMARLWTQAERFNLQYANEFRFQSNNFNLANRSLDRSRTDNVRSFGYFADEAAISQRAINESALVAEHLNGVR